MPGTRATTRQADRSARRVLLEKRNWNYRVVALEELLEDAGSLLRFCASLPLALPGLTFRLPLALPLTLEPSSRVTLALDEDSGPVAIRGGDSTLALELDDPGAGITVVLLELAEPEGATRSVELLELAEPEGAGTTRSVVLLELDAPGPGGGGLLTTSRSQAARVRDRAAAPAISANL